jgi:hypothetical protein
MSTTIVALAIASLQLTALLGQILRWVVTSGILPQSTAITGGLILSGVAALWLWLWFNEEPTPLRRTQIYIYLGFGVTGLILGTAGQ